MSKNRFGQFGRIELTRYMVRTRIAQISPVLRANLPRKGCLGLVRYYEPMPKNPPESVSGDLDTQLDDGHPSLSDAELIARVREAERRTLDYWLEAVMTSGAGSMTVQSMQKTVSWRVTRPLRAVRIVANKLRQAGPRRTVVMVRERLAQIRQARKRG